MQMNATKIATKIEAPNQIENKQTSKKQKSKPRWSRSKKRSHSLHQQGDNDIKFIEQTLNTHHTL